jgi:hypothetical protein
MVQLAQLWMPILLSAVLVFIASSIIWMATPLHKHDYKNPGDKEDAIMNMIKSSNFAPGVYFVPWCHGHGKQNDPAVIAKMKAGPWAQLNVLAGPPNMGKMLGLWFFHLLVVGLFVAYIASHTLKAGTVYLEVFRIAGAAALMAHAGYALPLGIWHGNPWSQLPGRLVDGIVYALLTAGTFAWLWPKVVGA